MPAVRLSDVAQDAGVSLATASRVLNGSARVPGKEVAERVRASADRLGYVPNAQAQALAEAHQGQHGRGPQADLVVGGQQADQERGDAHGQQRADQGGLAADPVPEVAEDDRAQRAGDEGHRKGRQRLQQRACDAQAEAASFAEKARADRKAGFVSFAEAQVSAGRVLPNDQPMVVATLEVLADAQPVEFAEGDTTRKISPAQWLQDLIAKAQPSVSFGEFAPGHAAGQVQPGAAKGKSDAEIDQAAKAYMRQHKVDYSEALGAVTSSFTA